MKKQAKFFVGIFASVFMMSIISFSSLAAEDELEDIIDDEEIIQTETTEENENIPLSESTLDDDGGQGNSVEEDGNVSVIGIQLNTSSITLNVKGQMTTLSVTITPSDATDQRVTWESDNTSVATVDNNGIVTAAGKDGTARITVTSLDNESISAVCTVKVTLYNGFQKDPNSSDWYYYKNGEVDTSQNSVMKGTIDGKSGWWNVVKGKVTKGETVAKNSNGWWYINSNGMVDFSYNGMAQNQYGWWYLENGEVSFKKNSVVKGKVNGTTAWWYVVGSEVLTDYTGLADYKNENGWWYVNNGRVTFNENTVAKNKHGWFYVKNSEVIFSYTGMAQNKYGWWYIENGEVTFNKNSVIKGTVNGTTAWWYVVGSEVLTNFTGLADYKNENGWWYINNGRVTFNVNTVAKNKHGWFYVKNSEVDFSYSGAAQNEYGWWYIREGEVDFSTGTVVKVGSDWLYYYDGKQDSSYTGIAPNEYGTWYVKNGKVDFSYTGTVTVSGTQYAVTNGQIGVTVSSTMNNKAQTKSSSTKWLIVVDTSACRLGVFSGSKGNWIAQKYWLCSPGKPSTPTKKGTFTVGSKGKSFGSSTYTCWYYTQFYGNYLMHSVLYKPGSMTQLSDGRLGQQLSHGCVRLALENAKWIYDNIPKGTTVYVY